MAGGEYEGCFHKMICWKGIKLPLEGCTCVDDQSPVCDSKHDDECTNASTRRPRFGTSKGRLEPTRDDKSALIKRVRQRTSVYSQLSDLAAVAVGVGWIQDYDRNG